MLNEQLQDNYEGVEAAISLQYDKNHEIHDHLRRFNEARAAQDDGQILSAQHAFERQYWGDKLDDFLYKCDSDKHPTGPVMSLLEGVLNAVEHGDGTVTIDAYETDSHVDVVIRNSVGFSTDLKKLQDKKRLGIYHRGNGLSLLVNNEGFEFNQVGDATILRYEKKPEPEMKEVIIDEGTPLPGEYSDIRCKVEGRTAVFEGEPARILNFFREREYVTADFEAAYEQPSHERRRLNRSVDEVRDAVEGMYSSGGANIESVFHGDKTAGFNSFIVQEGRVLLTDGSAQEFVDTLMEEK